MKFEFDFSELEDFAIDLLNQHEFDSSMMTATQNVARVLHQYLLEKTPIDTGNLRKMWSAGDNVKFKVEPVENGFQVTFINTARAKTKKGFMYGVAVNDGHKSVNGGWVMGRLFVEGSIANTEQQLTTIIMRELQKWWDGV